MAGVRQLPRAVTTPRALAMVGFAGACLIAISSYWVAAIPIFFRRPGTPVISLLTISGPLPRTAYYVGLAGLTGCWLELGRLTLARAPGTEWGYLRRIGFAWLMPLVFAMPIGSRDLWAYAAQGQLVYRGFNPYVLGPSVLPSSFASEVSSRWVETPAPYGPLWLGLGHLVAAVVSAAWLSVLVLRLFAVAGVALIAWALPTLAERAGGRADLAVWMVVANPMLLVLGVGGGHNDLLMVGLMMAGLAVATGSGSVARSLGLGAVIITAAIAVKSPAIVALAFVVPLWRQHAPSAQRWRGARSVVLAVAVVGVIAIVVFSAITVVSGVGWGWIHQINSSAPVVNWMSLPTLLAICWNLAIGVRKGATSVNATMRGFRDAGTAVTVVLLSAGWFIALRRWWWELFALALLVVVVLGPTVQPWYFCWVLAGVAVVITSPRAVWCVAAASIALVALIRPNGTGLQMQPPLFPIVAGAAVLAWLVLLRPRRAETPSAAR